VDERDSTQVEEDSNSIILTDSYIIENRELYDSLISVPDLRFNSLSTDYQVELMKTLRLKR